MALRQERSAFQETMIQDMDVEKRWKPLGNSEHVSLTNCNKEIKLERQIQFRQERTPNTWLSGDSLPRNTDLCVLICQTCSGLRAFALAGPTV